MLRTVGEAILAYEKKYGKLPADLKKLVPEFLPNEQAYRPVGYERDMLYYFQSNYFQSSFSFSNNASVPDPVEIHKNSLAYFGEVWPLVRFWEGEKNSSNGKWVALLRNGESIDGDEGEYHWQNWKAVKERLEKTGTHRNAAWKSFRLRLLDSAGQPLENIEVQTSGLSMHGVALPNWTYKTDAQGQVSIGLGAEPSPNLQIEIAHPGFEKYTASHPANTRPARSSIVLKPGQQVSGRCVGPDGAALKKAEISLLLVQKAKDGTEEEKEYSRLTTDDEGKWTAPHLPAAARSMVLRVSHKDCWESLFFVSAEASERQQGDLAWEPFQDGTAEIKLEAARSTRVKVRNAAGEPLREQEVKGHCAYSAGNHHWSNNQTYKTDAEGFLTLKFHRAASYSITLFPKDGAFECRTFHPFNLPAEPWEITAKPSRSIVIELQDAEGKPLPEQAVSVYGYLRSGSSSSINLPVEKTDAKGRTTCHGLPEDLGKWQISLYASTLKDSASQQYHPKAAKPKDGEPDVILKLQRRNNGGKDW
jgi:hypothetical protein